MWSRWSRLIATLSKINSYKVNLSWTDIEQKYFEDIGRIVAREIVLVYPDLNKLFVIYNDARNL